MTDIIIIEWKEKLRILLANFAMYIGNDTGSENDNHEAEIAKFEFFILEQLTLAEARGFSKGSNEMYFQTRKELPVSYQKGLKEGEEKARKEIITMLPTMKYGETKVHGKKSFQKLGYNAAIDEIIHNLCSLKQSQEEDLCHCHGNDPTHELGEYKIHCKHCEQFQDTEEK